MDDAEFLLEGVKPGEGDIDDLDFLHGSIALQRGDWQAAIARFRAMLARNPNLPRVRLDLAFAYFQAGQDRRAAYHFRLALGDKDLPPVVRARALAFLDRIRRRKSWSITGSLALAPDTNINAATSARRVALFGLPAQLSEDARQTSGVGVSANILGGYEGRISEALRFRTAAGLRTRTYEADEFNERLLSLRAGPRFLFSKFDLRPELTTRLRQLGGDTYSRSAGFELSGNWLIAPTWRLSAAAGGRTDFLRNIPWRRPPVLRAIGDRPCAGAGDVAAGGYGLSPRDSGARRLFLAGIHCCGFCVARAAPGFRAGGGAELPVAKIRRAAAGLGSKRAAGSDPGGVDQDIEPVRRVVRVHARDHDPA